MQVKRDSPAEALICSFGWTGPFNEQAWPPFPPLARCTWWMSEDHPHWFPIRKIISQALQLAMRKITHLTGTGVPRQVLLWEMVENSTSLCKSPFGWFFRQWAVRTDHLTLE
jgi:hypothetical protein